MCSKNWYFGKQYHHPHSTSRSCSRTTAPLTKEGCMSPKSVSLLGLPSNRLLLYANLFGRFVGVWTWSWLLIHNHLSLVVRLLMVSKPQKLNVLGQNQLLLLCLHYHSVLHPREVCRAGVKLLYNI